MWAYVDTMEEDVSISRYFSQLFVIMKKLKKIGENVEDIHVIRKVLRSFMSKYNQVVMAIKELKNWRNSQL